MTFFYQFPRIRKAELGNFIPRNHVGQHLDPTLKIKGVNLGEGAPFSDVFLDQQLVIGKGGHLRGVGDAEHLVPGGGLVQQLADPPGSPAGNAGIDFVVDDSRQRVAVGQCALEGEHNAGKLATRGDLGQRLGRFARVGRDQKLNVILPVGRKRPARVLEREPDARHVQKFQR